MNGLINTDALSYLTLLIHVHLSTRLVFAVQYNGPEYKSSYWKFGNAFGTVYGLDYYMTLGYYRKFPHYEPTVCFNAYDLKERKYGYFICPLRHNHYKATNCCGDQNRQVCCRPGTSPETNSIVLWLVLGGFGAIFVLAGVKILWGLVGDGCCRRTISECCDSAGCSSTGEYFRSLYTPCAERMAGIGKCCHHGHQRENDKADEINELECVHIAETNVEKQHNTENGDTHEVEPLNV